MAKSRETPLYVVWRPELGEGASGTYGSLDVKTAAEVHARYQCAHVTTWPVLFHVRDPEGTVWHVWVERKQVFEYVAGKATNAKTVRI